MATFINPNQTQFRGRNDDGNETAATWIAATNTNWSQNTNTNFRIRITTSADVGAGANTPISPTLYYSQNGGAYTAVTGSSNVVRLFTSSNVTDLTATTQQISSGLGLTFVAGGVQTTSSTGASANILGGVNDTEHEWCLQIRGVDVANNDTIALQQRTGLGNVYATYTQTPSITVTATAVAGGSGGSLLRVG